MLGSDPLMAARHRKTPVPRHQARQRGDGPVPGVPDRRLGSAMRRVIVTPTFAAGLGVVVAAVLAYPMQTVFSYVAPGALGPGGVSCGQHGCGQQPGPQAKPAPLGVGGGAIEPAPAPAAPDNDPPAGSVQQQPAITTVAQPRLSYAITSKWQGGFWAQLTITFPGAVPENWRLRFGYRTGHILGMNPNSLLTPNGHAVMVRSTSYSGGTGPGGHVFTVGVGVQGTPAQPAHCSFDGQACHIG